MSDLIFFILLDFIFTYNYPSMDVNEFLAEQYEKKFAVKGTGKRLKEFYETLKKSGKYPRLIDIVSDV